VFCRRMKRARDTQGEPERARKAYAEDRRLAQEARLKTPAQIERTAEQTEARQNRDERRLQTSAVKARVDEAMKYSGHWESSYKKSFRKVLTSILKGDMSLDPVLALNRAKLMEERAENPRLIFGRPSSRHDDPTYVKLGEDGRPYSGPASNEDWDYRNRLTYPNSRRDEDGQEIYPLPGNILAEG
jgi:hypothetical protein